LNMSQEMERSSLLAKSQVVVFSFSLLRWSNDGLRRDSF
jgi:hypothetical protein